jgi:ActR/RegA family two-component response regulator
VSTPEDDPPLVLPRASLAGIRALVLDDVHENAEQLCRSIEHLGGVAYQAHNITEAKRLLVVMEPDVALVDLLLLNGNGLATIREFREHRPALACILVSGLDVPQGYEDESIPFLPKPISLETLAATVLDAIGRMDTEPPPQTEREL